MEPKAIYLVGGAVRDVLLGRPVSDLDLLVEGFSQDELKATLGEPNGKSFPVWRYGPFEVAAARLERKTGAGHKGFSVEWGEHVTARQELGRRDFTVNALALLIWSGNGGMPSVRTLEAITAAAIVDLSKHGRNAVGLLNPFGGLEDLLDHKVLRATNRKAFREDPLRVLRLARFAARWPWMSLDEWTVEAARNAVHELKTLPAERVWNEWVKASKTRRPDRFFQVLDQVGALEHLPGFAWLKRAKQLTPPNHSESLFDHSLRTLRAARRLVGVDVALLSAALWHDRGKLAGSVGHDRHGVEMALEDLDALKAPRNVRRTVATWVRNHMRVWDAKRAGKLVRLAADLDRAGFDPNLVTRMAAADSLGSTKRKSDARAICKMHRRLALAFKSLSAVRGDDPALDGVSGQDVGVKLLGLRAHWLSRRMRGRL